MTRGSVAAVLVPGKPDSAGAQFFVVARRPAGARRQVHRLRPRLGRHRGAAEDLGDAGRRKGVATERIEITTRHDPRHAAASRSSTTRAQQLGAYRAVLDTSAGPITDRVLADKAPETVRQFLRLAAAGVYNGMAFHRVAPGFVIQTGALSSRAAPLTEKQQKLVAQPAAGVQRHEARQRHRVDGARRRSRQRDDVVLHLHRRRRPALDGEYTAFGRVVDGMAAVDAIEATPRNGETPRTRIDLKAVRIEKAP